MSITLSAHASLPLHLIRFEGRLDPEGLWALYKRHLATPEWARSDVIHVIASDVDVSAISSTDLRKLRHAYYALHLSQDWHLLRRSGFVCYSGAALTLVEEWIAGRHSRDGAATEFVVGSEVSALRRIFDEEEIAAVRSESGFLPLASIGSGAPEFSEEEFLSYAAELADSGCFGSADALHRVLSLTAPVETAKFWRSDVRAALSDRCRRAASA